jgi:exonuclease-1
MGLWSLVTSVYPGTEVKCDSFFQEKRVIVDINTLLYPALQQLSAVALLDLIIYGKHKPLTAAFAAIVNSHTRMGMRPLYVFDGSRPPLKSAAWSRKEARSKALQAINKVISDNAIPEKSLLVKALHVSPPMIDALVKEVLQPCGASFIIAPYEADSQCAFIHRYMSDYQGMPVLSKDSDFFVLLCKSVLRYHKGNYILFTTEGSPVLFITPPPPRSTTLCLFL